MSNYIQNIDDDLDLVDEIRCALAYGAGKDDAESVANSLEHIAYNITSPEGGGSVDISYIGKTPAGTFVAIEAWADYTGWGCQDGCDLVERDTFEQVVRDGVTVEMARALNVPKDAS